MKPVVLTVDDDPEVLRAVERDLLRDYAVRYRVLRADPGAAALDLLRRLHERGDPAALLRMCVSCGHVGCCDSSPNRHATKHVRRTSRAIVRSAKPGERWRWCFVDEIQV